MTYSLRKLLCLRNLQNVRKLHTSHTKNTGLFRHDGNVISVNFVRDPDVISIKSTTPNGFLLSNGIFAIGPIVLFPKTVLSWNVGSYKDINEESLILFKTVVPQVDVLVIGIEEIVDFKISQHLKDIARKTNLRTEVHFIKNAVPLYNFLVMDGRFVAAALIPPIKNLKEGLLAQSQPKNLGKRPACQQIAKD